MESAIKQLGSIWFLILAIAGLIWWSAVAYTDIQGLKANDLRHDAKLEAINTDLTQIKIDTSYIRAKIDQK